MDAATARGIDRPEPVRDASECGGGASLREAAVPVYASQEAGS